MIAVVAGWRFSASLIGSAPRISRTGARWAETVQKQPWEECYVYFKHDETEGSGPEAAQSFLKLIPR